MALWLFAMCDGIPLRQSKGEMFANELLENKSGAWVCSCSGNGEKWLFCKCKNLVASVTLNFIVFMNEKEKTIIWSFTLQALHIDVWK